MSENPFEPPKERTVVPAKPHESLPQWLERPLGLVPFPAILGSILGVGLHRYWKATGALVPWMLVGMAIGMAIALVLVVILLAVSWFIRRR